MAAKRPLIFGEVLFDRFPDGSVVLGGAPFNVAWHLQAFGLSPLVISRVGQDTLGEQVRDAMRTWGMDLSGLQEDPIHPTGTVEVRIDAGEPSYDIVEDRAYDFIAADVLPDVKDAAFLYHGSLALRNPVSRSAFEALRDNARVPRFFDVNLRPPWWQREQILDWIEDTAWLKLNADELKLLATEDNNAETKANALRQTRRVDAMLLTRGEKGAQFITAGHAWQVAPAERTRVVDTVGAGDAFASIMLMGLLKSWPPLQSLERAQAFASAIVGERGATVADGGFYADFKRQWSD